MSDEPNYTNMIKLELQIADLQSQLTQRTAELEAIEKILDIDSGKTTVEKVRDLHHSFKQVWESYQDASNEMFKAQAELERVRGELAEVAVLTKEIKDEFDGCTHECERCGESDPMITFDIYRTVVQLAALTATSQEGQHEL